MESTNKQFKKIKRMKPGKQMKGAWAVFHEDWSKLDKQVSDTMQKWTPDAIANEFFFGQFYQLAQQTEIAIGQIHAEQAKYFTNGVNVSGLEIQLGEISSSAQTLLATLKTKIDQAEKLPPTASGMPRKDGL